MKVTGILKRKHETLKECSPSDGSCCILLNPPRHLRRKVLKNHLEGKVPAAPQSVTSPCPAQQLPGSRTYLLGEGTWTFVPLQLCSCCFLYLGFSPLPLSAWSTSLAFLPSVKVHELYSPRCFTRSWQGVDKRILQRYIVQRARRSHTRTLINRIMVDVACHVHSTLMNTFHTSFYLILISTLRNKFCHH